MATAVIDQQQTLSVIVWRKCSCGHAAPSGAHGAGHGINTNIGLIAAPSAACLHDGCACRQYDGRIDNIGVVAKGVTKHDELPAL